MKITNQQKQSIPFKYAQGVLNDELVVGNKVKQAVKRFYSWIETADQDGYYLDHKKGMMKINFFSTLLQHTKGKSAGKPFVLEPFQQFTIYNVFAWMQNHKKYGPIRRINNVFEMVAKKNGKTATMAGLGLDHISFDLEPGAECYIGATKEEQAKLCFNQACEFIHKSPVLKKLGFKVLQREIKFLPNNSFIKPLGGDSKTQDGINSSLSIIDEYHAHRDDSVKENLESSMAERKQPLVYTITTAGTNIAGVCKNFYDQCVAILEGQLKDDSFFIMIHDPDEGDDWTNENTWRKANPNIGVTVSMDFLRKEFQKAKNQPSKIPNFKTKHLNMFVDAPEIWIPTEIWNRNLIEVEDYQALFTSKALEFGCYSGTDLSTRVDLSAHVLLTNPDNEGNRYLMPYFFCPKNTIDVRSKEDRVPYRYWADEGFLIATPGDRIDYDELKNKFRQTNETNKTIRNGFDSWNATSTVNDLIAEGFDNISFFSQAIGVINFPTKEFEILVYDGKIKHNGHPIMSWMLAGCVIYEDANGNIKVHKGRSHAGIKRVDGIIAAIIALGESLTPEDTSNESQYNDPEKPISFGV